MLKLVYCEFIKLKRRRFILLTILAAALFPVPLTAFACRENLKYDWLYMNIGVWGYFLLLPTVLGILGAVLFFSERINETQKNMNTIPVTTAALVIAKVIILFIFSVVYSLATNSATIIGGLVAGSSIDHALYRILTGMLISIMVAVSVLPVVTIECLSKKGYVFSVILSFVYAVVNLAIVFAIAKILTPLSAVCRWALPHMTLEPTDIYGLEDWFLSAPACVGVLLLTAVGSIATAVYFQDRREL